MPWLLPLLLAVAAHAAPAKTVQERIGELIPQLRRGLSKEDRALTLAVLDLEDLTDGARKRKLGRAFAERLSARLAKEPKLTLVERKRLDAVAEELKLGQSGAVDPNTAKSVGKLAAADAVLTGGVSELGGYYDVSVKVTDTATGKVLAAAVVDIEREAVEGGSPIQPKGESNPQTGLDLLESALMMYARAHIEDFQVSWPKSLDELVPKYLERLPDAGEGKWVYDSEEGRVTHSVRKELRPTQPRFNLDKILEDQKKTALRANLSMIATGMKLYEANSGEKPRRLRDLDLELPKAFGGEWLYDPKTGEVRHSAYPEIKYSPGR